MKRLLLALITTTLLTQAFAGELINRQTGDTIEFQLNRTNLEIEIFSTSGKVGNKTIQLKSIKADRSQIKLFALTDQVINTQDGGMLYVPPVTPVALAINVADVLMLPFKAVSKIIQNMNRKRDFKKLKIAINSTKSITVSNRRFERIENLLSKQ